MTDPMIQEIVNPFPGPQPYRTSDRARFYGREAVGHEFASTILAHRCVALFGPSGAGKSSVMQAAVISELDEDHDFRHVAIDGWPAVEETTEDHSRCKRCHRGLTNARSKLRGYGPECWAVAQEEMRIPADEPGQQQPVR